MPEEQALPVVQVFSLGGTVSMTSATGSGATPSEGADALVRSLPQLREVATVRTASLASVPSASLDVAGLLALLPQLRQACADGATGIVVTTGTDTLEEVAYLFDLVWEGPQPLVLTGAMRPADAPGADGPANLLAAVRLAASSLAHGRGCLVLMNDEVHAADAVRKTHTTSPAAFASPSSGPLGRVHEGGLLLRPQPVRHAALQVRDGRPVPRVALLRLTLGDDTTLLTHAADAYDGIVVEAFGGGHVPTWWVQPLLELALRSPVVLASRAGSGPLLRQTYGFVGSERELLTGGLLSAGVLDGSKARILLSLAMLCTDRADLAQTFSVRSQGGFTGSGLGQQGSGTPEAESESRGT